jgi:hypothetical protein
LSHFTTIQTQIRDLDALRDACAEMGLQLVANADARGYAGNSTHGEHVIRLNGPYDIALNRQPDGAYGLATDWWASHVEKEVGPNFGKLLQLYGVHKASREARKKGLTVRRQPLSNGSVRLVIGGVR